MSFVKLGAVPLVTCGRSEQLPYLQPLHLLFHGSTSGAWDPVLHSTELPWSSPKSAESAVVVYATCFVVCATTSNHALQVHRAVLHTGEQVVIKVQRPGLKNLFDIDMSNLKVLAQQMDRTDENNDFM